MLVNQPVNKVNTVSFLECLFLSPPREGGSAEGLKPLDKMQNWLSLKGRIELSYHLRLRPSGGLRGVTGSWCGPLSTHGLIVMRPASPWNRPVPPLRSPQACCCFDCCDALGWENKNGLKRECESTGEREREESAYYWSAIGYGESAPSFRVLQLAANRLAWNNILGLWMKGAARGAGQEQFESKREVCGIGALAACAGWLRGPRDPEQQMSASALVKTTDGHILICL